MNLHCKSFQHLNRKLIPCEYPKEEEKKTPKIPQLHHLDTNPEFLPRNQCGSALPKSAALCLGGNCISLGHKSIPCSMGVLQLHWLPISDSELEFLILPTPPPIHQEEPYWSSGINQTGRLLRITRQWLWGPLT